MTSAVLSISGQIDLSIQRLNKWASGSAINVLIVFNVLALILSIPPFFNFKSFITSMISVSFVGYINIVSGFFVGNSIFLWVGVVILLLKFFPRLQ